MQFTGRVSAAVLGILILSCTATLGEECAPSESEIAEILAQDFSTFDQSPKGWRQYAERGCSLLAGELIERYLSEAGPPEERRYFLHFHAGQTLASAGKTDRALTHFKQSFKGDSTDSILDWNSYVRATIAFFERDRDEVEAMCEKLLEQPVLTREEHPGLPAFWDGKRANLDVVEGFLACWDEPYKTAYATECREKYIAPDD